MASFVPGIATAIIKGFILVSNDSDLFRVEELSLENLWQEDGSFGRFYFPAHTWDNCIN